MQLVLLTDVIPDLVVDMRYASTRNIAHRQISDEYVPRLDESAAKALVPIAQELRAQGYRLVIWDAYRSPETQRTLRVLADDSRYVLENSNHCLGLALDVTLATLDGRLLDMGTDHDDFTERAHVDAMDITPEQIRNRQILAAALQNRQLFKQWPFEWWHFDYTG